MKERRLHLFRLAAAAAAFCLLPAMPGLTAAADDGGLLPAGEAAPAFEGVTIEGTPFVLEEELTGGPIFLVFWSIF